MIRIRTYRPTDARACAQLIRATYAAYNAAGGSTAAVKRYLDKHYPLGDLPAIRRTFARTPVFFVAVAGRSVVGLVRGSDNRIVSLFVDGRQHRQGIGTRLVERFERECAKRELKCVVLRAAPYAVPFYQTLGYVKTTGVKKYFGLPVQPMRRWLGR
jgi:GNAT superfamily N-acetyltransferase